MLRNVDREELGLDEWLPPLGPNPLEYEVVMNLDCITLMLSLIKGRHAEHLQ